MHLALGVFDGVHIGHQAVIARAVAAAMSDGGVAGLLTFNPHPIEVIAPGKAPSALLATLEHKEWIVEDLGMGLFAPLVFDRQMAEVEAEAFIGQLMTAQVRTLAVGEDWRFGRDRHGDVALLRELSSRYGFRLEAVPPVMIDGDRVSSTRIRQAVRDGNLDAANRMLGRRYSLCGRVVRGKQLGRKLGFPTANIPVGRSQLPPQGVWAVEVAEPDGGVWRGVANIGTRPTVGGGEPLLEVHLFDYQGGDLEGEMLDVYFERFLRSERAFENVDALAAQIARDVAAAKMWFAY